MKKAVIISKSYDSRLRPLTMAIPKPLLPINDKTLLEIQIEGLAKAGFEDIFLIANHKKEYIERFLGDGSAYGVRLSIRKEAEEVGSPALLSMMAEELADAPFLCMNGDILTLADYGDLYDYSCKQDAVITAAVKRVDPEFVFGNVFLDNDVIVDIEKEPERVSYILAGLYVFKPEALNFLPQENNYNDMEAFLQNMIAKHRTISSYPIDSYWLDVNRVDDLGKAQLDYLYYAEGVDRRNTARQ